MSEYKVGDKVVLTVTDKDENGFYPIYVLNDNFYLSEQGVDEHTEPLSTYTEPLEDTIQKYTVKIARLVMEKEELKDENERLKAENEKMSVKIDAYELCGDQHEEEYNQAFNQGAEAAWELARKITVIPKDGGYGGGKLIEIFNTALNNEIFNLTYPEAAAKVAEWEKAKEEVKVGDVYRSRVGNYFVIYDIDHEKGIAKILWSDLSNSARELDDIKKYYIKTGRHIDIDGFLKQIGEEQE